MLRKGAADQRRAGFTAAQLRPMTGRAGAQVRVILGLGVRQGAGAQQCQPMRSTRAQNRVFLWITFIVGRILHECAGKVRKGDVRDIALPLRESARVPGSGLHGTLRAAASWRAGGRTGVSAHLLPCATTMARRCARRRWRPSRACAISRSTTHSRSARCRPRVAPCRRAALGSHRFPHRPGTGQ